jgi:hypothetical protein
MWEDAVLDVAWVIQGFANMISGPFGDITTRPWVVQNNISWRYVYIHILTEEDNAKFVTYPFRAPRLFLLQLFHSKLRSTNVSLISPNETYEME